MKTAKPAKKATPRLITNGSNGEPTQDAIALRAYSLWEHRGHPQNQELEIWLQAEAQLRQSQNQHGVRA